MISDGPVDGGVASRRPCNSATVTRSTRISRLAIDDQGFEKRLLWEGWSGVVTEWILRHGRSLSDVCDNGIRALKRRLQPTDSHHSALTASLNPSGPNTSASAPYCNTSRTNHAGSATWNVTT